MTRRLETTVAIVGAGPAGMTAAIALRRAGVAVLVLDEAPRAGGQIFRQAPPGHEARVPSASSPSHERGHRLLEQIRQLGIERVQGATVWGAKPGRLELEIDGEPATCHGQHLLLATGAYDRSIAFPGWTLPGVITAGAAQVLVRGFGVVPGKRALVAGTGPLLLPTLAALAAAGVEVVAGLEACGRLRALRALPGVLGSRMRRREARYYAKVVLGGRLPYRMGWGVFAVRGDDRVQSAVIGRLDRRGAPRRDTAQEIDVDLVCTGYGLQPSIELAGLLGCTMHHNAVRGGWVPQHDAGMQTSVPGVWVAGEIAGIGGADVAMAEGELAGLSIAAATGAGVDRRELERVRRVRARERRGADALLGAFSVLDGLHELADDDTIVCRCEDVTLRAIRAGADLFGRHPRAVKMATRAGMGPCQGRICQAVIADLLRHRLGGPAQHAPCPTFQIPAKPVAVATVLGTAASPDET